MTNLFEWLLYGAPVMVLICYGYIWVNSFLNSQGLADSLFRLVSSVSIFACLVSLTVFAATLLGYNWTISMGDIYGLPLMLQIDILSSMLLSLCSLIGAVCLRYSRSYLAGDPRQSDFIASMALALLAVFLLVLSGSLLVFWLAWVAVSLALHRLLVFCADRPAAHAASAKMLLSARLSDGLLLVGFIMLGHAAGSSVISEIGAHAAQLGSQSSTGNSGTGNFGALYAFAMVCLVLAAALRSAQLPLHSWLTEVMETPTPVSALLHAGIVNAGGFLVLRFADAILLAPGAMILLIVIGGATALLASAIMLYQPAIKSALAWSTIAQMGFMLMQCGFGAFALAALHIVAHSFYKAHAFLSSGSAVELAGTHILAGAERPVNPLMRAGLLLGFALLVMALWQLFSLEILGEQPVASAYVFAVVLAIALVQFMLDEALQGVTVGLMVRLSCAVAGLGSVYFAVHFGMQQMMQGSLPAYSAEAWHTVLAAFLILGFLGLAIARGWMMQSGHMAWRVHLANGLYLGAWIDRLSQAFKINRQTQPGAL